MKLGVIGGSGLYDLEEIQDVKEVALKTPFGDPSDVYVHGTLGDREVYFLPRHARGHRLLPSEINHRANVYGFKLLGVDRVLSISAVGSLREELRPGDIVLPDQYFDRTKSWERHTFFGNGAVAHVSFGDPACEELRKIVADVAREYVATEWENKDAQVVVGGTYVNMEGPAFSTRAESNVYRQLGFDIVGMTSLAEAKLCREAEMCYQAASLVTDYDCWRVSEEAVSVEALLEVLAANTKLAQQIVRRVVGALPDSAGCQCSTALKNGLFTPIAQIPVETAEKLKAIISKYAD